MQSKHLLRDQFAVEVANPRTTFQECSKQAILTPQETEVLLNMIHSRNESAHIYSEELADTISKKVIEYNDFLQKLENKLALLIQENKYV